MAAVRWNVVLFILSVVQPALVWLPTREKYTDAPIVACHFNLANVAPDLKLQVVSVVLP